MPVRSALHVRSRKQPISRLTEQQRTKAKQLAQTARLVRDEDLPF